MQNGEWDCWSQQGIAIKIKVGKMEKVSKRIIIDALYREEIRVVLCSNNEVDEFDYQNSTKKSIKGNIYTAKVVRVEPSLQAAFLDYGREKHGFLPFAEVQFKDYKLPSEDEKRLAQLFDEQQREISKYSANRTSTMQSESSGVCMQNAGESKWPVARVTDEEYTDDVKNGDEVPPDEQSEVCSAQCKTLEQLKDEHHKQLQKFYRQYKVQDVIKRDQELLVQVVKEERGNKGASLTTQISLAGRYCVLMPYSPSLEGVSKKISDTQERQRIREIIRNLKGDEAQDGVLVRTAGANKTSTELKRDYAYLTRVWSDIKHHAKASKAPAFIYEEGDIIKRCMRDMYNNEIDEVIVSGEEAYNTAKNSLRLLLPKHVHKVVEYKDPVPVFSKYGIEERISKLYCHSVPLQSGGYIVINQTEALVAIDINSGKATAEMDIESTALKTNLEALKEVAKQVRLRDLSGLIVIDFIDMEERKNRECVEKELHKAFASDRARVQIGQISEFGLLEMSRQRMHSNMMDNVFAKCSICEGRGYHRSYNSSSLAILRAIHNEMAEVVLSDPEAQTGYIIELSAAKDIILNLLNMHQDKIAALSSELGVKVVFSISNEVGIDGFFLETKQISDVHTSLSPMSKMEDTPYDVRKKNGRQYSIREGVGYGVDNESNEQCDDSNGAYATHDGSYTEDGAQEGYAQQHKVKHKNYRQKKTSHFRKDVSKSRYYSINGAKSITNQKYDSENNNEYGRVSKKSNSAKNERSGRVTQSKVRSEESILTKIWRKIVD